MAEVIGTFAASIEIGKALLELKRKVREIREAPKEIKALIDDTTRLNNLLSYVLKRQNDFFSNVPPEHEIRDIEDHCKAAAEELLTCVQKLNTRIEKGRWLGSLRATLKKEEIKAHQERLGSAKLSLVLAQSTQSIILHHQQMLQTLNTHTLVEAALSTNANSTVQPPSYGQASALVEIKEDPEEMVSSSGSKNESRSISTTKPNRKSQSSYQLTIPARWLGWALQLQADRYINDWTLKFRTWNYVSDDSPIFVLSRDGKFEALQSLLTSKQGFVTDLDSIGYTALHYAFLDGNLDVTKLLLQHGADLNHRNSMGYTPFETFSLLYKFYAPRKHDPGRSEVRLFDSFKPIFDFVRDAESDDFIDNLESLTKKWSGGANLLTAEYLQEAANTVTSYHWPPYKDLSLEDRVCLVMKAQILSPSVFLNRLGQGIDQKCLEYSRRHANKTVPGLWASVATGIGSCIRYSSTAGRLTLPFSNLVSRLSGEAFLIGWRRILRQIIEHGGAEDFESMSLLTIYFEYALFYDEEIDDALVTELLQLLITEFQRAGMSQSDLRLFANHETARLRRSPAFLFHLYKPDSSSTTVDFVELEFGGAPDTWRVSVETYIEDEYGPSVEELVENIPGSWIQSNGDNDIASEESHHS